jgi:hypothetical protein
MAARLLCGRAFRLEGGFGKVDDASGVRYAFGRSSPEIPPFVRKLDLDETTWALLDKDLCASKRLERLKQGLAII